MSWMNVLVGLSNVLCALLGIGLSLPLIRRRVPMNRMYGVRLADAFRSEEAWYAINAYGGRRLVFWSVVLLVLGIVSFLVPLGSSPALLIAFASAPLVLVIGAFESWRFARRFRD